MRKSTLTMRLCIASALALVIGLSVMQPAHAKFYLREEARPLWIKADTDHDGYLSRPEITAEDPALLSHFDQADLDQDGKLDLGEFEILLISL